MAQWERGYFGKCSAPEKRGFTGEIIRLTRGGCYWKAPCLTLTRIRRSCFLHASTSVSQAKREPEKFYSEKKNAVGASGGDREVCTSPGAEHGAGAAGLGRAAASPGFRASPSPPAPQHFTQARLTKLKHHGLAWRAPAPERAFVPGKGTSQLPV